MTSVRLEHIGRRFGAKAVLDDINFEIRAGELFFLLGPSGCGKSTLLRIIAGLLQPDTGKIFFNDRDITPLPTQQRNAVMCFQSYALWPHMSVRENIRFGLNVRGLSRAEQDQRIDESLGMVQLQHLADRKPAEISGGEQQRTALARALAVRPDCLLLDEPLSNLDANLRIKMRGEIRNICKSAKLTAIYVTHDQKEALSVADRIALMNFGRIVQIGTAAELYEHPQSRFAAGFLGQTNLIDGQIISKNNGLLCVETVLGRLMVGGTTAANHVTLSLRPEQVHLVSAGAPPNPPNVRLSGKIAESTFLGETSEHVVVVGETSLKVLGGSLGRDATPNSEIEFDPKSLVLLND